MKMQDDLETFEVRLKKLRPSPLSPDVMRRLQACRPKERKRATTARFLVAAVTMAATALLLLAGVLLALKATSSDDRGTLGRKEGPKQVAVDDQMVIKSTERYLIGARPVGVWSSPNGRAYKVVQGMAMNQTVFRHPGNGAELKMIEPQQRVLLVALSPQ